MAVNAWDELLGNDAAQGFRNHHTNLIALVGDKTIEYILKQMLPYAPKGHLVVITPNTMLLALFGAVIMGLVAGLYPAYRAASMKPIEAIRKGA